MKAFLVASAALCAASVPAADLLKLGSGTNLADGLNWAGGVTPGSSDVATWDGTSLASGLTLGTNLSWQGIRISGSSGAGTVSVSGAGALTLGASGINLEGSAVSATLSNAVSLASNQSWLVNARRTLTLSGSLSGGSSLSIGGAPSRTSSLFLTSSLQTVATGMSLADVTGISGVLGGNWIYNQRSMGAHGYLVSSTSTSQVYWLQASDGAVKAVKVELVQSGADIQARVLAAKYQDGGAPGFNFETGGLTASLAQSYDSDGYGAFSLGLHSGSAPSNQAGFVTLSGDNSSFSGNLTVNQGRLFFGAGTAFDGGSSPSRGTGVLTVGPLGIVSNTTSHAIWGGHTNSRSVILNGGLVDISGGQEYFHTLEMTAGLITRGNANTTNLFRVGSATGAGQITTNASNASAIVSVPIDLTFNSLTLNVADGAAADDLIVAGAISQNTGAGSGAKTLTKSGSGRVFLQAASSFTGGVTVNAGTIRIGNQSALGTKSTAVGAVTVASGGTVDINGVADATYGYTLAGAGAGGLGALVNNGGTIGTFTAQTTNIRLAANATIGGSGEWGMLASGFGATSIDLAGFTLTKVGSGGFHLANTTFTAGALSIQQGAVFINLSSTSVNASAVAVTLANVAGASLGLNGKSLTLASLAGGGANGGGVTLGDGTLTVGDAASTTYSGSISGTGGLVKQGSGTLTLAGSSTFTGATSVTAGALELTGGALAGNASVAADGTLRLSHGSYGVVYGGQLTGTGNVVVSGASNDLQLSGNNSGFTGTLTVSDGAQLRLRNDNAVSGASLVLQGGGAVSVYNYIGNNALTVGSLASGDATTWVRLGSEGNRGMTVGSNNQSTTFAGVIKNDVSGTGFLTKVGSGTLTLTGANTYGGDTTVSAGTLEVGGAGTLGAGTYGAAVSNAGTLAFSTSANQTLSGVISGAGSLAKSGSGTLTLGGANTFTGGTTLAAGTLRAGHAQAFGTSAVRLEGGVLDLNGHAVANTLRLAGGSVTGFASLNASQFDFTLTSTPRLSGTISGTLNLAQKQVDATGGLAVTGTLKGANAVFSGGLVTLAAGAIHAPGDSPGSQTFGAGLAYSSTSVLQWEIDLETSNWTGGQPVRGEDYDAINVTGGNLDIASGAILRILLIEPTLSFGFSDSFWDVSRTFSAVSFTSSGQISGTFTQDFSSANLAAAGQGQWGVLHSATGVSLTWTPVPEPSTYGLVLGGICLAAAALRRRSRRSSSSLS